MLDASTLDLLPHTMISLDLLKTDEFKVCISFSMRLANRPPRDYYYIAVAGDGGIRYLHNDGQVHFSAFHNSEPSGWYETLEEVRVAINLYRKNKNDTTRTNS